MRYFVSMVLLSIATASVAQITSPPKPDSSTHVYRIGERPLPPSIAQELSRSQKNRTLVYRDTVRAADLEKEHFNDSTLQNYSDSAISMIDTAVSLPHKEWLDSELIEIPELTRMIGHTPRLGIHVHYNYPPSMTMETDFRAVPFDSTLVEQMNPVTRENLPFFDQSPIPMPLIPPEKSESFLEAGGGNIALPRVAGWLAQSLSERSVMNILGEYRSLAPAQSAIHSYGNFIAALNTQLGEDPSSEAFHSQDLTIQGGYATTSVATINISTNDHALGQLFGLASMEGDLSETFHYDARLEDHEWNDNFAIHESSQNAALGMRFDVSNVRVLAEGTYSGASLNTDTSVAAGTKPLGSVTTPIGAESAKALVGQRKAGDLEWYAGAEYLGGSGMNGAAYSAILPVARARMPLNARWELGATFEPQVLLASARLLSGINPFYSPGVVLQFRQSYPAFYAMVDGRSVVMDKINLAAFMNYLLSPDDEVRIEARYTTRDREPVFNAITIKDTTVFTVTPESTQRFEFTAAGNFLLFARDVLTGSAEFCSATLASGGTIPFEPSTKFTAEYHLNSIWNNVQPSIAFNLISRPGQTFTFLDVKVDAEINHAISVTGSIENLFGGASDFWPGYPEKPRSIWATVRYTF